MFQFPRALSGALVLVAGGMLPLATCAQDQIRAITTAVPILTISPDARSAALGEAGVAISPDANSIFWNTGKLGFVQHKYGVSLSYTPWLRQITDDMGLSYLSGYRKIGNSSAFSLQMMYFNLGEINFRDIYNQDQGSFSPKEYTLAAGYGQKLSPYLGVGVAARFIHSNLTGGQSATGSATKPGNSAAVDLGTYYTRDVNFGANTGNVSFGLNISNIGAKISYTNPQEKDFLPTQLRLGTAITYDLDPFNKITLAVDGTKLLVPTPPTNDLNGLTEIRKKSMLNGIFSSFNDAPDGASEEVKEINLSIGAEYWYNDLIAARVGYFYEDPMKGNRKYLVGGLGLRYQVFGVDAAYIFPSSKVNPLAQTIRVSLQFKFEGTTEGAAEPAAPSTE